jgi:hypothetical protein
LNGDARFRSSVARNRALTLFAFIAGGLAAVIAVVAFTNRDPAQGVVLEVETAALSAAPAPSPTVPSAVAAPTAVETEPTTQSTLRPSTPTAPALPAEKIPPTALTVKDLSISQPVLAVGLQQDGAMEVPDVEDIGWYRNGAVPGRPGATVFVAHVWWGDTPGPFSHLGALEPGALIDVEVGDTVHSYVVVERTMYDKDSLPRSLWRNTGPETLVLITCGGDFDNATNRYKQNIVVLAVPVADAPNALPS